MPVLSVIVPVYNVARYLAEGLDSLLGQDFRDIEIICVDDASTDESSAILSNYASRDSRIRIFRHETNLGPSAARNTGISNALGDFVAFFDPDDLVEPDMYSSMTDAFRDPEIDVVFCGFRTFPNGTDFIHDFPGNVALEPRDFLKANDHIHSRTDMSFSWRMMVRRRLLETCDLSFIQDIRIGEDAPFNLSCTLHARKVMMIPKPLYRYRTDNAGSLMSAKFKPALERSLSLQFSEKKRLVKEFSMDEYTPVTKDMSSDIIRRFVPMLLANAGNNPYRHVTAADVKRILNLDFVRDACDEIGYKNVFCSWKEHMFYLAVKLRCVRLVKKLYFK